MLHGNNVDDILIWGAVIYLVAMFIASRIRANRIKKAKARRRLQRQQQTEVVNIPTNPPDKPTE